MYAIADFTPYNAVDGMLNTFEPTMARVSHDGQVFWTRPGTLDVLCRFSGLANFPYDTLSCPIEIGGWLSGGETQGLTSHADGCAAFEETEEVSLASFQEMNFQKVECSEHLYVYSCCPSDPYPVIKYRVFVTRASAYYDLFLLIPTTLFTLLSFTVFFMSFEVLPPSRRASELTLLIHVHPSSFHESLRRWGNASALASLSSSRLRSHEVPYRRSCRYAASSCGSRWSSYSTCCSPSSRWLRAASFLGSHLRSMR